MPQIKLGVSQFKRQSVGTGLTKKHVLVDMPNSVMIYNQGIGGVDLLDEQIATYRIRICSKN